jgi:thiopeptide-type bacteriocin biosynthesis protein
LQGATSALDERSACGAHAARRLSALASERRLTRPLADIAGSLLHMHANRLLRSDQRAHELVLYDFLTRIYESQIARSKRGRAVAAA